MSLVSNLQTAFTRVGTEFKTIRTMITGTATGDLTGLQTTVKTSVVAAINEARTTGGTSSPASETTQGIVELATLAEVAAGTDATRAVTAAGVRQERVALKAEILGVGVPAALDTLDELAAALADDQAFSTTVTTALANRVRTDTAAQGLTGPQQVNARTNIAAAGAVEVGDTTTDFAAGFVAALA